MATWENTLRQHRNRHRRDNPSFSSSLLDAIYRSIDDTNAKFGSEDGMVFYAETTAKKMTTAFPPEEEDGTAICRRALWMEKKTSDKVAIRRNSMADFDRKARNVRERDFKLKNSSSSSSDSSCGAGFSSSESEYFFRPKPIKTCKSDDDDEVSAPTQKPKIKMDSVKAKYSKALRMYNELKKVKQPISPGGKLATFLNSLFNGGSLKKPKFSSSVYFEGDDCSSKSKSEQTSCCSSASSFSKSCLNKTPHSVGKLSNNGGTKRSVTFCPVSVIVEESQQDDDDHPSLRNQKMLRDSPKKYDPTIFDDDDDDDAGSDSSSDLFELENLKSIGVERYREELPVYETTYFNTNRAIANNGLIM